MGSVAIILGGFFLLFIGSACAVYCRMFRATHGRRIADYPHPRRALMVLDLQEGYQGRGERPPVTLAPASGLFAVVNRLIEDAVASGMEVVYVRQVFGSEMLVRLHGGRRQGRVVVDRRIRLVNDHDFAKNRTDAFSNRELEQFLVDCQINELFLVGVDAAYCVYYTALGGLNRGYRVNVVSDAVLSRQELSRVVTRYRRRGIGLVSSDELLRAT